MKTLGAVLIIAAVLAVPASGQTVRVLAVADFVDESIDGASIGAPQLSTALAQFISERAAGRFRVIAGSQVRDALRARGYGPRDLVSLTRAGEIAVAVGAELIVTGRWTVLTADRPEPLSSGMVRFDSFGQAVLEIRVLEVATRRILLQDSASGTAQGGGSIGVLWRAARFALLQAAARISDL